MIKTNVRPVEYKMLDVWIEDGKSRRKIREFFADYLLDSDLDSHSGEMEVTVDGFLETLDEAGYGHLGIDEIQIIATILRMIEDDNDISGVLFTKKEGDIK